MLCTLPYTSNNYEFNTLCEKYLCILGLHNLLFISYNCVENFVFIVETFTTKHNFPHTFTALKYNFKETAEIVILVSNNIHIRSSHNVHTHLYNSFHISYINLHHSIHILYLSYITQFAYHISLLYNCIHSNLINYKITMPLCINHIRSSTV